MKKTVCILLAMALLVCLPITAAASDEFGIGVSQGNTYWNDAVKLGCTLDESWYFYTDEEILEQNAETAGKLKGDLAEAVKEAGSLMDMMALNTETGENVNVNLERLSIANSLLVDEDKYIEPSAASLGSALEQVGIEGLDLRTDKIAFLGEEHPCIRISGKIQDVPLYETLVVVKTGRTMIVVTACSYLEDTTEEILSCFYNEKP